MRADFLFFRVFDFQRRNYLLEIAQVRLIFVGRNVFQSDRNFCQILPVWFFAGFNLFVGLQHLIAFKFGRFPIRQKG